MASSNLQSDDFNTNISLENDTSSTDLSAETEADGGLVLTSVGKQARNDIT